MTPCSTTLDPNEISVSKMIIFSGLVHALGDLNKKSHYLMLS